VNAGAAVIFPYEVNAFLLIQLQPLFRVGRFKGIITLRGSSPRCEPKQSWEGGRAASIPPPEAAETGGWLDTDAMPEATPRQSLAAGATWCRPRSCVGERRRVCGSRINCLTNDDPERADALVASVRMIVEQVRPMLKRESFPIAKIYVPVKRGATLRPEAVREIAELSGPARRRVEHVPKLVLGTPAALTPMIWPEESLPPLRPSSVITICRHLVAYATFADLLSHGGSGE
jgi:hypothetical protein